MSAADAGQGGDTSADRRAVVAAGLIALIAFVPALRGGFVYDDHRFVEANHHLGHVSILWRAFSDPSCQTSDDTFAGLWRPLRTLSFALDRAAFGASPFGPHAVSVALHAAGAACVTALLVAWRLPAVAAALGGAVYALHPAQVECVAWISSRGDLLAIALVCGALLLDLRGRTVAALALGSAALLSKEQAFVWPVFVVLSRLLAGSTPGDALRAARIPAAVVAAFWIVRAAVLTEPLQQGGLGHGAPGIPVLGSMLAHQAWTAAVPGAPVFDWQMPWVGSTPAGAALVALGVAAALVWRPSRAPAAWFLAGIAPTWAVQAFIPLNILVADRFLLFALPALALFAARGIAAGGRPCAVAGGAMALCLAVQTQSAIPVWRSDATLWGRTASLVPGHWRANAWLGDDALRAGRPEDAERSLITAARSAPGDAKTRWLLAGAQELVGKRARDAMKVTAALENYRAAIAAFRSPRAEGGAELLLLARWAEADLLLLLGGVDEARIAIDVLLAEPPRTFSEETAAAFEQRRRQVAERAEMLLGPEVAARIRLWGTKR